MRADSTHAEPIAVILDPCAQYPESPPYQPHTIYPELASVIPATGPRNDVYENVRELLRRLGFDADHAGTPRWNPLGAIMQPGHRVVIKPNLVSHDGPACAGMQCMVTHASVVRPIVDYCLLALGRDAEIVIADVPLQSADWEPMVAANGLQRLVDYYQDELKCNVRLMDLRPMRVEADDAGFFTREIRVPGDPKGYSVVDVAERSWLDPLCDNGNAAFRVSDYDAGATEAHHRKGTHQYYISNTFLDADVLIGVPKLKTHEKAGMTCNLKNLVGINGDKSWLPHFRKGSARRGGDEWQRPSIRKSMHSIARNALQGGNPFVWKFARTVWYLIRPSKDADKSAPAAKQYFEMCGAWHGNDTVWRMVLDLNAIIEYYHRERGWCDRRVRKYFFVVDGIVIGEREGPLRPSPKHAGLLLAGLDPAAGDAVAAWIMGFDFNRLPLVREAFNAKSLPLTPRQSPLEVQVVMGDNVYSLSDLPVRVNAVPAAGWRGVLERASDSHEALECQTVAGPSSADAERGR